MKLKNMLILTTMFFLIITLGCDKSSTEPENTIPVVDISSPASGLTFGMGESIHFVGSTEDEEDDQLFAENALWESSIDGPFAGGFDLEYSNLSLGVHTITFSYSDSDEGVGSKSISIVIDQIIDNEAPYIGDVFIPTPNSTVSGIFLVETYATDNISVARVVFEITNLDGYVEIGTDPIPDQNNHFSYGLDSSTYFNGIHIIRATAYDDAGNSSEVSWNLLFENATSEPGEMVLIPGGTFFMGDRLDNGSNDETPVHSVTISAFMMGKYEVTQAEYESILGSNPSSNLGDERPVENISWIDAATFCNALSVAEGLAPCYDTTVWTCDFEADGYRLPTEAEWEFAARGGNQHADNFEYSGSNIVGDVAIYNSNNPGGTADVGTKASNQRGLYDMSGNVFEWCNDWYNSNYYDTSSDDNPTGPENGSSRVNRGGSWDFSDSYCRVANRSNDYPVYSYGNLGIRVVKKVTD